jgi:hypothetical protein
VTLGGALQAVKPEPEGGLSFDDAQGTPRLRMPKPWAVDAAGQRLPAHVTWEGSTLTVSLDRTEGVTWPVLLDPVVQVAGWVHQSTFDARQDAAAATLGSTVVLFGGQLGNYDQVGTAETWVWNGTSWTQKFPATSPGPRFGHRMSALGSKVVLFGGKSAYTALDDTWEWDGTTWTARTPATKPSARSDHAMGTLNGKVIIFGGATASYTVLGDTWQWDGTTWSQLSPATSPTARYGAVMAPLGTRLVLFGGADFAGGSFVETWEFDGTTWLKRPPATSPAAAYQPSLSPLGSKLVFTGFRTGTTLDTWEWDGTTWTRREPARRGAGRLRRHPRQHPRAGGRQRDLELADVDVGRYDLAPGRGADRPAGRELRPHGEPQRQAALPEPHRADVGVRWRRVDPEVPRAEPASDAGGADGGAGHEGGALHRDVPAHPLGVGRHDLDAAHPGDPAHQLLPGLDGDAGLEGGALRRLRHGREHRPQRDLGVGRHHLDEEDPRHVALRARAARHGHPGEQGRPLRRLAQRRRRRARRHLGVGRHDVDPAVDHHGPFDQRPHPLLRQHRVHPHGLGALRRALVVGRHELGESPGRRLPQ